MMSDQNDESTSYQPSDQKLCENRCGFYGSPATMNLCSKCFIQSQCKNFSKVFPEESPKLHSLILPEGNNNNNNNQATVGSGCSDETLVGVSPASSQNRCKRCNKKVKLNGFECRCGGTFCVSHRHREEHDCPFNIKELGREMTAKNNPLIKADKLRRI